MLEALPSIETVTGRELPCAENGAGISEREAFVRRNRRVIFRHRTGALVSVVILALLLLMAWPALKGHVYVADDLGNFHLPLRSFYARQLAEGLPFDWCPDLFCGFYLTGEGQAGTYHPIHLLLYRWLPLTAAFNVECLLSYPLLLAGVYLFLRRWRMRQEDALFGGLVFTFGGFNLLHFVHPNAVAVMAHLPWILVALDIWLKSPDRRSGRIAMIAIALLTGSQFLLGYPQYMMFSWMAGGGYFLALCVYEQFGWQKSVRMFAMLSAILVLGALLGAVQWMATAESLMQSVRQDSTDSLATYGSLHPLNLVQLVAPYLFASRVVGQNTHELGIYTGMVPLVLAALALLRVRDQTLSKPRRQLMTLAVVLAGVALLWAAGGFGPLGWLQEHLPVANRFRFPARAIVVFQLGIALLAAVGLTIVRRGGSMPRLIWILPACSVFLTIFALLSWPRYVAAWPHVVAGPFLMLVAVGLACLAMKRSRWALPALIVVAAADLGVYGFSYSIIGKTQALDQLIAGLDQPPASPDGRVAVDLAAGQETAPGEKRVRQGDQLILAGWKQVDGYVGLEPARKLNYREPAALRVAGVTWISRVAASGSGVLSGLFHASNQRWAALDSTMPRAWCAAEAIVSEEPASDISRINLAEQLLVSDSALISLHEGKKPNRSSPGKVVVATDQPGEIDLEVETAERTWLVVNESFHNGWRGTVDGDVANVHRVNGDFLGIELRPGIHRVEFEFSPQSLWLGRILSGCGLGLTGVLLVVALRKDVAS